MVETLEIISRECGSGAKPYGVGRSRKYTRANSLLLRRSSSNTPLVLEEKAVRPRKVYYPGFALLRIAAALGVIQIHTAAQPGLWVNGFRALMVQERVPTFMLMALFLTVGRQIEDTKPGRLFRRLRQLLIPFVAWMLIYDGGRYVWRAATGRLQTTGAPILSSADQFMGKGWHLYFLEWLAAGTVVAFLLASITRWLSTRFHWPTWIGPAVVGIASLAVSFALDVLGAQFDLASCVSLGGGGLLAQGVKLLSGIAGYAHLALPYVAIALMIHAVRRTSFRLPPRLFMCLGAGAMALNLVIARWSVVYPQLTAWLGATGGLVFGLSIPHSIRLPALVQNAARASYGIFLFHVLGLEFFKETWARISHQPTEQIGFIAFIAIVLLTFLTSWFVSLQLQRFAFTRRLLLGAD